MQQVYLIQINGRDHPGLTRDISSILSAYNADVLDIGQSVIHNTLALGLLIAVNSDIEIEALIEQLHNHFLKAPIDVSWKAISEEKYNDWVSEQGKNRYILTLLSKKMSSSNLHRVSEVVTRNGLNIETITRLSGRVPLQQERNQNSLQKSAECIELSIRGEPENISELRKDFLTIANDLEIDIAFQMDSAFRRNRRLVVFDMDSTLIEAEVIDELAKYAGVGDEVSKITEQAMRGEIDFKESFSKRLALLKGLDEACLKEIANELKLTEGAQKLISTLRVLGYRTAIISGGFEFFGHYIKQKLGMDYVFANQLQIIDGKLSGEVSGEVVDADRKAKLLRELAEQEEIDLQQVIAVGDGANDLKMLSTAGLGIAFRAKPLVKESAKQSISTFGLDGILYLMGIAEKDIQELLNTRSQQQ
jgi:phosphoserine phosphatase